MTIAETPLLQGQDITASYRMAQRRMLPSLVWGIVAVEVGIASRFAWERSWPWVGLFLLLAVSGLAFLQWWKARSEQSLRPAVVHSLLVVLWFSLLSYTFAAGPVESLGLYTLASLPLLAACFLSARDSSLWGGLSFFSGLAVWSFASDGLTSPLEPGASIRALTLFSWAHGAAFLIILLFLFLLMYLDLSKVINQKLLVKDQYLKKMNGIAIAKKSVNYLICLWMKECQCHIMSIWELLYSPRKM